MSETDSDSDDGSMFSADFVPNVTATVESGGTRTRHDHVTVSWSDLSVFGNNKGIIKSTSGTVTPGTLLAIMGSSGAGKSTLMNVIANRNLDNLTIDGDIMVNGSKVGDKMATMVVV